MASPGTFFMFKICQEIYKWADDVFYSHATKGVDIKVEFSDCFVPGEGEIKILEAIRNNPNCRHVVYTKDSDFVLLLLTSCEENIILVNDYQKIEKIILVKRVRDQFGLFDNQQYKEKLNSILLDMVFLSISFGNDYLKPMSHEQKLLNLLLRYKKKKQKYPEKSLVHIEKNTIGLDLEFFTKILIKSKDVQPSMKRSEEETLLTLNYLKSLLWCIGTYESGVCRNYSQFSHCTPPVLLSQMIQDMRILAKRDKILMLPTIGDSSLLPVTFLMSIMPFTVFRQAIPKNIISLIESDRSLIVEYQNHSLKPSSFFQLKTIEQKLQSSISKEKTIQEDDQIWCEKLLYPPNTVFKVSKNRIEDIYLRTKKIAKILKKSKSNSK